MRRWLVLILCLFCLLPGWPVRVLGQQVTLNLKEVEIQALIQMVSEVTKKNFVVDERVKGKVTVISSKAMSEDELYQVFLSILSVHGFAAIPAGNVVKVLPEAIARSLSSPVAGATAGGAGDELVTHVIGVKHVDAAKLIPILRPLVPQEGHLAAYPESNSLIISDRAANVQRLLQIIQRVDQSEQSEIEVVRLNHASAAEVVRMLTTLEQRNGQPLPNMGGAVADERTNSVLLSGDQTNRLRLKTLVAHMDTPLETVGNTQVVFLHYAQAKNLMSVLQGVSDSLAGQHSASSPTSPAPGAPVDNATAGKKTVATNIQADETTNSLIITAAPDVQQTLAAVIRQLDVRRAQVMVEAVIAEIESTKIKELGVQWVADGSSGGSGPVGLINFGGAAGIASLAASLLGNTPQNVNVGDGALLGGGRFNNSNGINFAVLLKALAGSGGTNVLSTPSLVTLDNQEAEIVVGQNVPFVTGQYTNTGAAAGATNPFQTIKREDVGLKLRVKPQINEGSSIKLEIEQEVSSVTRSPIATADVVTNKRTIKTTVMVDDGGMVVLGGLMDETLTDTTQKVPGLGDIPLVGGLFRYQKADKTKRNLLVFLRPTILRGTEREQQLSQQKYQDMRKLQLQQQENDKSLLPAHEIPMLPVLDDFMTVLPGDPAPLRMQASVVPAPVESTPVESMPLPAPPQEAPIAPPPPSDPPQPVDEIKAEEKQ